MNQTFENGVISYSSKATYKKDLRKRKFENGVISYSSKAVRSPVA